MFKKRVNLIVAVDSRWGIAKNGRIPWDIKEDKNFFTDVTKRIYGENKMNAMILGKNSWKEITPNYRGLKDRINVVVSSTMTQEELILDNETKTPSYLCSTFDHALQLCQKLDCGKIFICGGVNIYKEAMDKKILDEIYLTKIDHDYETDAIFPYQEYETYKSDFQNILTKQFTVQDHLTKKNVKISFEKYLKKDQDIFKNKEEEQYLDLLDHILKKGHYRQTRNGYTYSVFAKHMEFDLNLGFPLLTTKRVSLQNIFHELIFFLKGESDSHLLSQMGVKIWDANTSREFLDSVGLNHYEEGGMGNLYGFNWRHFGYDYQGKTHDYTHKGFDQINYVLDTLKKDPFSRRIMMTTFDPSRVKQGPLWPCHSIVLQFHVEPNETGEYKLNVSHYQRSGDIGCGIPYNITSACILCFLLCEVINNDDQYHGPKFIPGKLVHTIGDVHIYDAHKEQIVRQILREPYSFPQLKFKRKVTNLIDFKFDDLELINYISYPNILMKMIA
jgi:dihydrofolate reductase / thymidylate synthase